MDFWYKVCCCCCHREEELEKNPLVVGDTLEYFNKLQKRRQSEAANLWNEPVDRTHMERDDDHELHKLLKKRSKMRRGSEGYRRLSFDIIAHRQIRRKLNDRWRQILEALGFKDEADGLLTVTSSTTYESLHNPQEARRLHNALAQQTSIFGRHRGGPPERYLFVLDRLLLLDVGEDFFSAARHFYPVEETDEGNTSSSDGGPSTPGPVLVKLDSEASEGGEIHGHTLIDIGTGPTIYQLLSACDYFEEIVATDYLEVNRAEIYSWVHDNNAGAFDWSPYIQHVCRIEGKGEPWKEKEQKLKKKLTKILPIDVHQPNPLGYELRPLANALVSAFCLEAVSPDRPSFDRALRNVTTLLKPGGHFLMIGALEESFYLAGEAKLSVVPMKEADIKESFANSGYRVRNFRSYDMPPSLKIGVDDVQGIFFIHAQKSA